MSDYSWKYEIVFDIQGEAWNDVEYFVVYRLPLNYMGSYARLAIVLPPTLIQEMKEMVGNAVFPHVNVVIYSPYEMNTQRRGIVAEKSYRVIGVLGETVFTKPQQTVVLQLVHPILLKLALTKTYDKHLGYKTGIECLSDFEEHVTKTHGGHIKVHRCCDEFHQHIYEESLATNANDLYVPQHIIEQRPVSPNFPIYFYDDFNFSKHHEVKDINAFLLDYSKKENFKPAYNLDDFREVAFRVKAERIIPLGDDYKELDKFANMTSLTYVDSKNMVSTPWRKFTGKKFDAKQQLGNLQITRKKDIKTTQHRIIGQQSSNQSTYEMTIGYPDTISNAVSRINSGFNFLKKGPRNLHFVTSNFCLVDWVHFGCRYALNPDELSEYVFVPFNIVNIFVRQTQDAASRPPGQDHPVWMKHYCRATFFEYEY